MRGWQVGTIVTLQDGFPLTATCSSGAVQNGGDTCLADATGINPNLARGQQDPRHFFNTDAFVNRLPGGAQFRYGNAGRGTIIGPGILDLDFSLAKRSASPNIMDWNSGQNFSIYPITRFSAYRAQVPAPVTTA